MNCGLINGCDDVISLKVRISLPPSRAAPKRTAAERKSIVESEDDDNDSTVEKKKSPSGKRGRPKKGDSPNGKSPKGGKKEYEVQKVIDDEMRGGKKYYRIRWKGWGAKDDTWEPKGMNKNRNRKIKLHLMDTAPSFDQILNKIHLLISLLILICSIAIVPRTHQSI